MKLFAQLTKVDEEKRLVYGRAAEEAVDKSDEIMDYMSSKPHFQKWSADLAKDTDGKNLGNVRAMHGKVAAGALKEIEFKDGEKAIDVCAKIVDDAEWKKVLEGVYTGFSIGGSYVGEGTVEKMDGREVKRYTANPTEISLVDRPCMSGAKFFEVRKVDGSLAKVDFQPQEEDLTVDGTPEELAQLARLMKGDGMSLKDVLAKLDKKHHSRSMADESHGTGNAGDEPGNSETEPEGTGGTGGDPEVAGKGKKKVKSTKGEDDNDGDHDSGNAFNGDTAGDGDTSGTYDAGGFAEKLAKLKVTVDEAIADMRSLAKYGARTSKSDKMVAQKIHDHAVDLGASCAGGEGNSTERVVDDEHQGNPEKHAHTGDLAKIDNPLQKVVTELAARLEKLESQPGRPTISLRAVSKGQDLGGADTSVTKSEPIVDDLGDKHEAAGLIKSLHRSGGAPLHIANVHPASLRKD